MKSATGGFSLRQRITALALAAGTFWGVVVTAGSDTLLAAGKAVRQELMSPLTAVRWELGDWWARDTLSPATVLAIGESPLLLSARAEVAALWSKEEAEPAPVGDGGAPETVTTPVTETPLETDLDFTDNGVPARTLIPSDPSGYTVCGSVYLSNSTDHVLELQKLTEPFAARITEGEPQILILHTHGSESYTPPSGVAINYSGDHRTTDTRYNVVHVGDAMSQVFADLGLSVLHDRTLYDYPAYAGSYDRSLAAINSYLAQYPSIRFILDIHRDAIEDGDGNQYKVVSVVEGEGTAAQMTLVMGSDGSGLSHPSWMENLKLAVALQSDLLSQYPTLMRPVLLRNSRYNQHATTGSLLVEVGAAGNSPDEAVLAGRLFAQSMGEYLLALNK